MPSSSEIFYASDAPLSFYTVASAQIIGTTGEEEQRRQGLVPVWATAANNARLLHSAGWFPSQISCTKSWVGNGGGTMKTALLFGATMLLAGTSVVTAYDLTTPYTGSATPAGTPEWTWSGFYVAPFTGVGWSKNVWSNFDALGHSFTSGAFGNYSADSFSSGSKIGSAWQFGRFSFGAEVGTGTLGGFGSGLCFECGSKTINTVTGRAGVAVGNTQFYLEGSRGWAR